MHLTINQPCFIPGTRSLREKGGLPVDQDLHFLRRLAALALSIGLLGLLLFLAAVLTPAASTGPSYAGTALLPG